jgi:2-amino-4-hydroxy-6-hydroxymethyldihydropteridine diphosphokinase
MSFKYIKNNIIRKRELKELIILVKVQSMTNFVFLGLGTNLGDRESNLNRTLELISKSVGWIDSRSGIYETEPWGFSSEDHFLNMVIRIKTGLSPVELLKKTLNIEILMGRIRGTEKYASRIIDIDILLFENKIINKPYLKVPHPMMQERKFVLVPLCDFAPEMIHPVFKKTFRALLEECSDESIVKRTDPLNHGLHGVARS